MTHEGYIKLYRSIRSQSWYADSQAVHLFVHLLLKASHSGREILLNGQPYQLVPGQLLTGRKSLAHETGIHESKIQRLLRIFESCEQIEQQTNTKNRVITVLSWHKFQSAEQPANNDPKPPAGTPAPVLPGTAGFELLKQIGAPAAQMWTDTNAADKFQSTAHADLALRWMQYRCDIGRPLRSHLELIEIIEQFNRHSTAQLDGLIKYSVSGRFPALYYDRLQRKGASPAGKGPKLIDPDKYKKYRSMTDSSGLIDMKKIPRK